MRIYLAGPMSGYPEHNYPAFFEAENALSGQDMTILNPARNEAQRPDSGTGWAPWSWYMRQSIKQIAECDVIVVLPGWEDSRGALLEVMLAAELGIPVFTIERWLDGVRPGYVDGVPRMVRDEWGRMWFSNPTTRHTAWIHRGPQTATTVVSLDALASLHGPLTNVETGEQIITDDPGLDDALNHHPAGGNHE